MRPQCAAATVGHVAAAVPLVTTPALGGEVGPDKPLDAKTFWLLVVKHKEEQRGKAEKERLQEEEQRRAEMVAGGRKLLKEWKRRKRNNRRKRRVLESASCPSSSCAVRPWKSEHFALRARRLWQSCPVSGFCFDSGYMYMRRFSTCRWTSDPRPIFQAIWTLFCVLLVCAVTFLVSLRCLRSTVRGGEQVARLLRSILVLGEIQASFWRPCTQVQGREGHVHRDTASIIRRTCQLIWIDTSVHHSILFSFPPPPLRGCYFSV